MPAPAQTAAQVPLGQGLTALRPSGHPRTEPLTHDSTGWHADTEEDPGGRPWHSPAGVCAASHGEHRPAAACRLLGAASAGAASTCVSRKPCGDLYCIQPAECSWLEARAQLEYGTHLMSPQHCMGVACWLYAWQMPQLMSAHTAAVYPGSSPGKADCCGDVQAEFLNELQARIMSTCQISPDQLTEGSRRP